jgi:hypothetical protein
MAIRRAIKIVNIKIVGDFCKIFFIQKSSAKTLTSFIKNFNNMIHWKILLNKCMEYYDSKNNIIIE